MTTESQAEALGRLLEKRTQARKEVIKQKKMLDKFEQTYYLICRRHQSAVKEYMDLDREYALERLRIEQLSQKKKPTSTPYDMAKRTYQKAIKALEGLPKELKEKILLDMKDGVI